MSQLGHSRHFDGVPRHFRSSGSSFDLSHASRRQRDRLRVCSLPQLAAAKVSKSSFRPKQRKFRRHFKGVFSNGNIEVRILPSQPRTTSTRDSGHLVGENPAKYGLSRASRSVSSLRIAATLARICRKSPAKFPDIPVFGRLLAETDFDLHWVAGLAGEL
jgi:hypothetical protein